MKKGFTLVELIVVLGILMALFALGSINLLNSERKSASAALANTLISDIRGQQLKSMLRDSDGQAVPDSFGVYIEPNQYVLFQGDSYNSSNPSNVVIPLDQNIQLSTNFPSSALVFASGSGEVVGFVEGSDQITLQSPTDTNSVGLVINRYGVVDYQN